MRRIPGLRRLRRPVPGHPRREARLLREARAEAETSAHRLGVLR